jgi:hypothetical protein
LAREDGRDAFGDVLMGTTAGLGAGQLRLQLAELLFGVSFR